MSIVLPNNKIINFGSTNLNIKLFPFSKFWAASTHGINLSHNCSISQAEMELGKLTYFLFILPVAVAVVELRDFYPYGSSNGDTVMIHNDDGSSGIINIAFPFPFFDEDHNSLYVSKDFILINS